MTESKVLFVGGNWDDFGGRPSRYMSKFIKAITNKVGEANLVSYNGGHYEELKDIVNRSNEFEIIFWFPNIPTDKEKLKNPKDVNKHAITINYKRNDNNKYHFQELISISMSLRTELTCEVRKTDEGRYELRVFDTVGTVWSDFNINLNKSVAELFSRLSALRKTRYAKYIQSGDAISVPTDKVTNEVLNTFNSLESDFKSLIKPKEGIQRVISTFGVRGYVDPTSHLNDTIFVSERSVVNKVKLENFVAVKMFGNKLKYYGFKKPNVDAGTIAKLFNLLPNVNYVIHSHVYASEYPFTERSIPSGGLQMVDELMKVINKKGFKNNFCVNVIGHGCFILTSDKKFLNNVKFESRNVPELLNADFHTIEVDDGIASFIHTLNGSALKNNELIEVKFTDGSVGTYECIVKHKMTDKFEEVDGEVRQVGSIRHSEAFIELIIKGVATEYSLVGHLARRV